MCSRLLQSMITVAMAAGGTVISMSVTRTLAQAPAASVTAPTATLKTPWGEPDLQGIWMDEVDTPLQRPARFAGQGPVGGCHFETQIIFVFCCGQP
jgi:hypothetical protein